MSKLTVRSFVRLFVCLFVSLLLVFCFSPFDSLYIDGEETFETRYESSEIIDY